MVCPKVWLLVLLLVSLPRWAAAEGESEGFWWSPSLRVATLIDDNVFYEPGDGKGAVGVSLAPRVEAGYRSAAFEVGGDVGVDVRRYWERGSELDEEFYRALVWGELGIGPGWSLRLANAYTPQAVMLGIPQDDAQNWVQTNRSDAELRWWRALDGGRTFSAGVVGTRFEVGDYEEQVLTSVGSVVDPSVEADYLQGLAYMQIEIPLAEWFSVWGRWQASYRDFDALSDADYASLSLLAGISADRWMGFEFDVSGAAGAIDFERLGTSLRALAQARAVRRFDGGFSIWASGGHVHSPDLSGEELDETTGEIGLEQRFGSATAASLRLSVSRLAGDLPEGGSNFYGGAEVELRQQLTRRMQVGLSYRHWRNAGAISSDDFTQNRVRIEFGFRL